MERSLPAFLFALAACGCQPTVETTDTGPEVDMAPDGSCIQECFCGCVTYSIPCSSDRACDCTCLDAGPMSPEVTVPDAAEDADVAPDVDSSPFRVLVYSRTAGFRHGSIPDAVAAIESAGAEGNYDVEATEDPDTLNAAELARFDVVAFVMTTGDVLGEGQQTALEEYIRAGGGWVGIHSASDTEYDWPWYGGLVGAYFSDHPSIQDATLDVEDATHPSTTHLDARWPRRDEWYNFATNPRDDVHVLATLDESTYDGGSMGDDHPIAWCHAYDGGRSWYTAGGHTSESYEEPDFVAHLVGGLRWAAGRAPGSCDP